MSLIANVIIAIGFRYGNGGAVMQDDSQFAFADSVRSAIRIVGGTVHATVSGNAESGDYGSEPSAWFAASVPTAQLPALRTMLSNRARWFGQESIALTVGATEFVEAAPRTKAPCGFVDFHGNGDCSYHPF